MPGMEQHPWLRSTISAAKRAIFALWRPVRFVLRVAIRCVLVVFEAYSIFLMAGACMGVFALGGMALGLRLVTAAKWLVPLLNLVGLAVVLPANFEDTASTAEGGVSMVISFGLIAFWVRSRARLVYSVAEIVLGAVGGLLAISHYPYAVAFRETSTSFFALFGGIYIVVRGLDNLDKSLVNDTVARRLFDSSSF